MRLSEFMTASSSSTESMSTATGIAATSNGLVSNRLITGSAVGDFLLGVLTSVVLFIYVARSLL